MFEFVCDRIVPGCTHRDTGNTQEEVREKAARHLQEHHEMEFLDEMNFLDGKKSYSLGLAVFPTQSR